MFKTDDPLNDFERYMDDCYERIKDRPKCCVCDEHIPEEYGYYIRNDWYCEECIQNFKEYFE